MNRARMVAAVWDWLPAFRAIAETQHLPTAAKLVGVTPPALSRTLRVLEAELEIELFRRVGRRLQLSDEGAVLLSAVRDAMRLVHDSLDRIADRDTSGPVLLSSTGLGKAFAATAIAKMVTRWPRLDPRMRSVPATEVGADLLAGRLDVALVTGPLTHDDLVSRQLTSVATSIWCGQTHPLFGIESLSVEAMLEHHFVAPPVGPDGLWPDGWPLQPSRGVSVVVEDILVAMRICLAGAALAVLPDGDGRRSGLFRLPVEITQPLPLYVVRRRPLADASDRAQLAIALIEEAVSESALG